MQKGVACFFLSLSLSLTSVLSMHYAEIKIKCLLSLSLLWTLLKRHYDIAKLPSHFFNADKVEEARQQSAITVEFTFDKHFHQGENI